jgi:hypothetical protein
MNNVRREEESMLRKLIVLLLISATVFISGCATKSSSPTNKTSADDNLVGAWRAKVQFKSGTFSSIQDLEFMYVFNSGGTMIESSNYDASPPVPPAYGVWRMIQPRQYEVKYIFYVTKAPQNFKDISGGGGWSPGGSGVFVDTISLSEDGKTFKSRISLDMVNEMGKPIESKSKAEAQAVRISF